MRFFSIKKTAPTTADINLLDISLPQLKKKPQPKAEEEDNKNLKTTAKKFSQPHQHIVPWETSILGFTAASHDHNHEDERKKSDEKSEENLFSNSSKEIGRVAKQGYSSLKSIFPKNSNGIIKAENSAKQIAKALSDFGDQLKTVDGIDETANLVGQVLPAFEQAVATTAILAVFTPLVLLGVMGMTHEYQEAREQMAEILHRQTDSEAKLYQLRDFATKYQSILANKFDIEIPKDQPNSHQPNLITNPLNEANANLNSLALTISEIVDQRNKFLISELGVKYGFTGIVGMSGMFAGMVSGVATGAIDIENILNSSAALQVASTAGAIATSSLFMVGQTMMMVYATNRGRQGVIAKEHLSRTKETFENIAEKYLPNNTQSQVSEIITRQIKYIDKHSIEYAILTDMGQTAMISGTVMGFFDLGTASIPLFAFGASTTIFAAINRIVHQDREKKFFSDASEEIPIIKEYLSQINPVSLISNKLSTKRVKQNGKNMLIWNEDEMHKEIFSELSDCLEIQSQAIANLKIFSLLHHIINDTKLISSKEQKYQKIKNRLFIAAEKYQNPSSSETSTLQSNAEYVAQIFTPVVSEFRGHGDFIDIFTFKGTARSSLEGEVVKIMKEKIEEMEKSENQEIGFIEKILNCSNHSIANKMIINQVISTIATLNNKNYQQYNSENSAQLINQNLTFQNDDYGLIRDNSDLVEDEVNPLFATNSSSRNFANSLQEFYQDLGLEKKLEKKDYANPDIENIDSDQLTEIITTAKKVAKKMRTFTADAIVKMTQIVAAKEVIRDKISLQNLEEIPSKIEQEIKTKKKKKPQNESVITEEEIKIDLKENLTMNSTSPKSPNGENLLVGKSLRR